MFGINHFVGFWGASGIRVPVLELWDWDSLSTLTATPSLTVNVKPGLLIIAKTGNDEGGTGNTPTCTVNGQGAATEVIAHPFDDLDVTFWYREGNTVDGAQQFDFSYGDAESSHAMGVWSFSGAKASDILTSDSAEGVSAHSKAYAGAATSMVLHAAAMDESGASGLTGEGVGFTVRRASATGAGADDHAYFFEDGDAGQVTGGDIDFSWSGGDVGISAFVEIRG